MTKLVVASRALVVHEKKLLLVSHDGSYWYLPGGRLEPKENLISCVKREVYEETGYEIAVGNLIYLSEFYDSSINSHKIECCFYATLVVADKIEGWKDLDHSITMQHFFSLKEIQEKTDIQPSYLKDGKWLNAPEKNLYRGYETN